MIRVLRLMEYTYPDAAAMEEDMARWSIAPNGTRNFFRTREESQHRVIRSAVLTDFKFPEIDDDN